MNNIALSTVAVIVTYNRLGLLQECIGAIKNQSTTPEAIIVINNGSTDGTAAWLEDQKDLVVYNQKNLGGAGGFYRGIKEAYELGYNWIWAMDDDGYPAPDCMQQLQACIANQPDVDVWGCIVFDRDEKSNLAFQNAALYSKTGELDKSVEFVDNWAPFFNGVLFSKNVIQKFGYPNPSLFIWGDEVDYLLRIVNGGGKIKTTTKAVFYHPKDRLYSVKHNNFYVYTGGYDWKAYCFFRNRAYIGKLHYNSRYIKLVLNQLAYNYKTMPLIDFFKSSALIVKAHRDGLNFDLTKKLPY